MKSRFNAYNKTTGDFMDNILVACPSCDNRALVKAVKDNNNRYSEEETKVTCARCGYNKILTEKPKDVIGFQNGKNQEVRYYYLNTNVDPYFRLPLWLQKEFPEGFLWAYNYEHLEFLENHIAAGLRERDISNISNQSIGSRLPKWMTSSKNRKELIPAIQKLKKK